MIAERTRVIKRHAALGILAGLLLAGVGSFGAGAAAETGYGPCQTVDPAFMKCVHYKLQEAHRFEVQRGGGSFTAVIRDTIYFYWVPTR